MSRSLHQNDRVIVRDQRPDAQRPLSPDGRDRSVARGAGDRAAAGGEDAKAYPFLGALTDTSMPGCARRPLRRRLRHRRALSPDATARGRSRRRPSMSPISRAPCRWAISRCPPPVPRTCMRPPSARARRWAQLNISPMSRLRHRLIVGAFACAGVPCAPLAVADRCQSARHDARHAPCRRK